jgi:hypothetical protein
MTPDRRAHSLVGNRRCRRGSAFVTTGAGLLAGALATTALPAQSRALTVAFQGGGIAVGRVAELLLAPVIVGLATGLITWGAWRTKIAQHDRVLHDHKDILAQLAAGKVDKDAMVTEFEHLRELLEIHLKGVERASQETADEVRRLRSEQEARAQRRPRR